MSDWHRSHWLSLMTFVLLAPFQGTTHVLYLPCNTFLGNLGARNQVKCNRIAFTCSRLSLSELLFRIIFWANNTIEPKDHLRIEFTSKHTKHTNQNEIVYIPELLTWWSDRQDKKCSTVMQFVRSWDPQSNKNIFKSHYRLYFSSFLPQTTHMTLYVLFIECIFDVNTNSHIEDAATHCL